MPKKVLITGISGFAGCHLAEYLLRSDPIKLFGTYLNIESLSHLPSQISQKATLIKVDLTKTQDIKKIINDILPDEIYHLAAISSPAFSFANPEETIINNILAQTNLLEAVRLENLINTKILIVSSADVYGKVLEKDLPINENTPLRPENPYAVSKIAQDFQGLQYVNSYNMHIVRVRAFNHIGPRQSPSFVVSRFAKEIAEMEKGKGEKVLKVGNLKSKRDFTDVRDMMKAYTFALEKGAVGDVYNIGTGKSHAISEILEILSSFARVKFDVRTDPSLFRPSDCPDMICDSSKFRNLTGWEPKVPLETTLKDTLEYWRNIV